MDHEPVPPYGVIARFAPDNEPQANNHPGNSPASLARQARRVLLGVVAVAAGNMVATIDLSDAQSQDAGVTEVAVTAHPRHLSAHQRPSGPKYHHGVTLRQPRPRYEQHRHSQSHTHTPPTSTVPKLNFDYASMLSRPVKARFRRGAAGPGGVEFDSGPYSYSLGRFPVSRTAKIVAVTEQQDYVAVAVPMRIPLRRGYMTAPVPGWVRSVAFPRATLSAAVATEQGSTTVPAMLKYVHLLNKMAFRYSFAYRFNCPDDACNDGKVTPQSPECDGEVDANNADLDTTLAGVKVPPSLRKENPLYTPVGKISHSTPLYVRATTLDNKGAIARTSEYGWDEVPQACVPGLPQGGPPNTDG